jgi:CBS domain-containing protein
VPIQDLARSDVVTASQETPVTDIAATMDETGVGSVVITEEDTPVGIVTDRDLAIRIIGEGADPSNHTAGDVMSSDLCTVEPGAGFYKAADLMADHGVRRLPVCEDGSLVGIITADDLNELLADEHQQFANVVRTQRPSY